MCIKISKTFFLDFASYAKHFGAASELSSENKEYSGQGQGWSRANLFDFDFLDNSTKWLA